MGTADVEAVWRIESARIVAAPARIARAKKTIAAAGAPSATARP
jgi:hypothetical protein